MLVPLHLAQVSLAGYIYVTGISVGIFFSSPGSVNSAHSPLPKYFFLLMNHSIIAAVQERMTIVIGKQVRFISYLNDTRWLMSH